MTRAGTNRVLTSSKAVSFIACENLVLSLNVRPPAVIEGLRKSAEGFCQSLLPRPPLVVTICEASGLTYHGPSVPFSDALVTSLRNGIQRGLLLIGGRNCSLTNHI